MTLPWRRFIVPTDLLARTEAALQSFSRGPDDHHEGFVYWGGRRAGNDIVAIAGYIPNARTTWGSVTISEAENAAFVAWLRAHELIHVAQVHSHPPGIDVHSDGDDAWVFMKFPGLVSIVVPDYAEHGMRPLDSCGVHVFNGDSFHLLDKHQVRRLLVEAPFTDRRPRP